MVNAILAAQESSCLLPRTRTTKKQNQPTSLLHPLPATSPDLYDCPNSPAPTSRNNTRELGTTPAGPTWALCCALIGRKLPPLCEDWKGPQRYKERHLGEVPDEVGAVAELTQEAAAPPPPCGTVEAHEAGVVAAEVPGPEVVHDAAHGGEVLVCGEVCWRAGHPRAPA